MPDQTAPRGGAQYGSNLVSAEGFTAAIALPQLATQAADISTVKNLAIVAKKYIEAESGDLAINPFPVKITSLDSMEAIPQSMFSFNTSALKNFWGRISSAY